MPLTCHSKASNHSKSPTAMLALKADVLDHVSLSSSLHRLHAMTAIAWASWPSTALTICHNSQSCSPPPPLPWHHQSQSADNINRKALCIHNGVQERERERERERDSKSYGSTSSSGIETSLISLSKPVNIIISMPSSHCTCIN